MGGSDVSSMTLWFPIQFPKNIVVQIDPSRLVGQNCEKQYFLAPLSVPTVRSIPEDIDGESDVICDGGLLSCVSYMACHRLLTWEPHELDVEVPNYAYSALYGVPDAFDKGLAFDLYVMVLLDAVLKAEGTKRNQTTESGA